MWRVALAIVCLAAIFPTSASAKDFQAMVLVGADGRSAVVRPNATGHGGVLDSFFDGGSPYNRGVPATAEARGGFVLVYVLGTRGLPGIPGRFYPSSRAACFAWNEARLSRPCFVPNRTLLRLLAPTWTIPRPLHGAPRPLGRPVSTGPA